jgi:DNA-binding NtrC family response regulator
MSEELPPSAPTIIVVEDDPIQQRLLGVVLREEGWRVVTARRGSEARQLLESEQAAALILDLVLPDCSGDDLLSEIRERHPDLPIIVLSAQDSVERAVEIMRRRPYDYLVKPVDPERLVRVLERALHEQALTARVAELEREVRASYRFDDIVGAAPQMQRLYDQMEQVLKTRDRKSVV